MPSSARQRIPADLLRPGNNRGSCGRQGSNSPTQIIQAHPGLCDTSLEDKQRFLCPTKKVSFKSSKNKTSGRGSPKSIPRKGSTGLLDFSGNSKDIVESADSLVSLSSSAQSDGLVDYNSKQDSFAMDSSTAPHPDELPLPPLEWLRSSSKGTVSPVIDSIALQRLMGCYVSA